MEKASTQNHTLLFAFFLPFLLLTGTFYCATATATTNIPSSPITGQQLAYFIGYHYAPGYAPSRHYHSGKSYWTGWRYVGHGCRKTCLVDRWSNRIIRCKRVCRY